jgi:hypothetical protein
MIEAFPADEIYDEPMADEDLVQLAERALADAEEAYRLDPSDANQRRIMSAWSFVRRARRNAETERRPPGAPPGD